MIRLRLLALEFVKKTCLVFTQISNLCDKFNALLYNIISKSVEIHYLGVYMLKGFIVFVYGLVIGSFINVLIYRVPRSESIAFPSSHCPKCGNSLKWYDNIPVVSFVILKGRCRYCGDRISAQYPLIELVNAFSYLLLYIRLNLSTEFIFLALLTSILLAIAVIDIKEQVIPDSLVISILILTIIYRVTIYLLYGTVFGLYNSILGALLGLLLFVFIVLVSRGGMGAGDVTLVTAFGFVLGWKNLLVSILLSFIVGAIVSLILLGSGKKTRKDPIPFGPFLIIGFYLSYFFGNEIIRSYYEKLL